MEFASKADAISTLSQHPHTLLGKVLTVEMHKNGLNFLKQQEAPEDLQSGGGQPPTYKLGNPYPPTEFNKLYQPDGELKFHPLQAFQEDSDFLIYQKSLAVRNAVFQADANSQLIVCRQYAQDFWAPSTGKKGKPRAASLYNYLKRTHVQKRLASKYFNEANYAYRRRSPQSTSHFLARYQRSAARLSITNSIFEP